MKRSFRSILPVAVMAACTAASSCVATSCAEYPLTGSLFLRDPGSGAKGGLTFTPGQAPTASVKVPIYDGDGNLTGYADLSGPLSRQVNPTK